MSIKNDRSNILVGISNRNYNHSPIDKEVLKLIESNEFLEFVQSIEDSLEDGLTFNELLSSPIILQHALAILKKNKEQQKNKK